MKNTSKLPILYEAALARALDSGLVNVDSKILVLCAGERDKMAFEHFGFKNVTLSNLMKNLDPRMFEPYEARSLDAEDIDCDDEEYDFCVVHAGLHHCRCPHYAVLEMLRVSKVGILACEPYDSWFTRVACRLGFSQTYEIESTLGKEAFKGGGLRFGGIPNYVYRFTERDVEKCVKTGAPYGEHEFHFLRRNQVYWARFQKHKSAFVRWGAKLFKPVVELIGSFPVFANKIAIIVTKPKLPEARHPWLAHHEGEYVLDKDWVEKHFS